ncbi:hypothetical protein NDU88_005546, partial [Pleurodeles waltl]
HSAKFALPEVAELIMFGMEPAPPCHFRPFPRNQHLEKILKPTCCNIGRA